MRFSPGCECCGPDFPTEEECCGFDLIASTWEFEFTTITGDLDSSHLADCSCTDFNTTWQVESGGGCSWFFALTTGSGCSSNGVTVTASMVCVGDDMILSISILHKPDIFTPGHQDIVQYSLPLASFDPLGPNVLDFDFHVNSVGGSPENGCTGFPATLTITPV